MSHNRTLIIFIGLCCITCFAGREDEVARLKGLLSVAMAQVDRSKCRDATCVVDNLRSWQHKDAFCALQTELIQSWQVALSDLDEIAPTDIEKTIVLCSCWRLSETAFIKFLNATADLADKKGISPELFKWCQWPLEGELNGFLLRKHANPEVQAFVLRSRRILENNPDLKSDYDPVKAEKTLCDLERGERNGLWRTGFPKRLIGKKKDRVSLSDTPQEADRNESMQSSEPLLKPMATRSNTERKPDSGAKHTLLLSENRKAEVLLILLCFGAMVGIWLLCRIWKNRH